MSNATVKREDVPSADAPFKEVISFAQAVDGYAAWGGIDEARGRHQLTREVFDRDGALPATLTDLRAALALAQREHYWAWTGGFIEPRGDEILESANPPQAWESSIQGYMRALVDRIREEVS
jgi:hypothetical protein